MKSVGFFFLTWLLILFNRCNQADSRNDPDVLAVVDRYTISREQYIARFNDIIRRTGLTDNMETRRQVLKSMIDECLLIREAYYRGLDGGSAGKQELERIKIQELLNSFNRKFIQPTITVNNDELKRIYVNLNTKILARHLYAPTKREADSLYNLLQQGVSFEKLAFENFHDPVLRESGGSLGYFSVDEMDPVFEEAAFSLAVGETSKPVHTNDGYSIIRVDDRWTKPIITENEFAQKRSQLESYWIKRKTIQATRQYVDSLRRDLKISFNESLIQELYRLLKEQYNKGLIEPHQLLLSETGQLKDQELLISPAGTWNIQMFREQAKYTSPVQQDWIRSAENLKDFIAELFVRSYILKQARKAGLDKTGDYKHRVAEEFDNYLLESMENHIVQDMEIPQDSLLNYYNDDPQRFAIPAKVYLREIVLNTKKDASLITNKLRHGSNFTDLARQYSVRRRSGVDGGNLGYLTPEDLGSWSGQVFALKPNEWRGPFQSDSMYIFLQCVEKKAVQPRSFESAKEDIGKTIRNLWQERERNRVIDQIRSRVKVVTYTDKLTNIRIN